MENVVSIIFSVESEAYQAMTELRKNPVTNDYMVSQAGLVKAVDGKIVPQDSFDTGIETANDTAIGGLIGALFGIIGGPIGMLLTGSMGALAGSIVDTGDAVRNASLLEKVTEQFANGETAIIALTQENIPNALDTALSKFSVSITREDAAEVAAEVKRAQELQRQMERDARKRLREERRGEHQQEINERREKLKAEFENLKKKFSREK